ncbi:MAG: HvfA family oxazolone/thioamide-modified RiPP metallophore [Arenimonas sp.]
MSNKTLKPFMLATGAILLGGLAISQSAFAVKQLGNGYQVTAPDGAKAAEGKCGEGKCGAEMKKMAGAKATEGKCGEGKCGMSQADTNKDGVITKAEHTAQANSMFAAMDKNKDGKISSAEMKAKHEGKCGEGKCGAEKK